LFLVFVLEEKRARSVFQTATHVSTPLCFLTENTVFLSHKYRLCVQCHTLRHPTVGETSRLAVMPDSTSNTI